MIVAFRWVSCYLFLFISFDTYGNPSRCVTMVITVRRINTVKGKPQGSQYTVEFIDKNRSLSDSTNAHVDMAHVCSLICSFVFKSNFFRFYLLL